MAETSNTPPHPGGADSSLARIVDAVAPSQASAAISARPRVRIETTLGTMLVELYPNAAPETVDNFLYHVSTGKYDGVMFESVNSHNALVGTFLPGFVPVTQRDSIPPCPRNESDNGLSNLRGTLSTHHSNIYYQGLAHFCFNLADNLKLDYPNLNDPEGLGSAVFGAVIEGIEVLDALAQAPRGNYQLNDGNVLTDVPIPTVTIVSARVVP